MTDVEFRLLVFQMRKLQRAFFATPAGDRDPGLLRRAQALERMVDRELAEGGRQPGLFDHMLDSDSEDERC